MKLSLATRCILGLLLGIALGLALSSSAPEAAEPSLRVADTTIRLWTNALRLIITPLVVSQLFLALAGTRIGKEHAARLGWIIPAVFIGLLVFAALLTVAVTSGLLASPFIQKLGLGNAVPPVTRPPVGGATNPDPTQWVDNLIPPNLVSAASRPEAMLGLLLVTLAVAIAARRLDPRQQQPLHSGFEAARDVFFVLIGWLVQLAPVVLLALGLRSALSSGLLVGEFLLVHLGIEVTVLLICLAALYPIAVGLGRVSPGAFARVVFPAQAAAAASRSSISTIPILLRDASALQIPQPISALVIPLAGATLKLSPVVNYTVKFLFLSSVLGIPLSVGKVAVFAGLVILLSPATQGIPSVIPTVRSLPAFVAAGIPVEYVLLLGTTRAITDIFLSTLNSTGYLTAALLVSRRIAPVSAPTPAVPGESRIPHQVME